MQIFARGPYAKEIFAANYSKIRSSLGNYIHPAMLVVLLKMDLGFYTSLNCLANDEMSLPLSLEFS